MALVTTVLLLALAATIVVVIATQSIDSNQVEANRSALSSSQAAAQNAEAALQAALQANPYFFYSSVFSATINGQTYSERARVCPTNSATIQPGSAWSLASCGPYWTYTDPATAPTAWIELTPPSISHPQLGVHIMATVGGVSSGLSLQLAMNGSEQYSLYTPSNLDVTVAPNGSTLSGSIYTAGALYSQLGQAVGSTATQNNTSFSNAQVEAESGFYGAAGSPENPADPASRYYAQTPNTSLTPPIRDIRSVVPQVLTASAFQSSLANDYSVACPGGTPFLLTATQTASSLCLKPGATVLGAAGNQLTVPANAAAFLILTNPGAKSLSVWYSTTLPHPDQYDCVTNGFCDFGTEASADYASMLTGGTITRPGTNPGIFPFWTTYPNGFLGNLAIPQTGLVFSSNSVYLSACSTAASPTAFANTDSQNFDATCPAINGSSSPGMEVPYSMTILAGTATSPADIWIDGSINTDQGVSFGAVASGSIYLPYWSHTPGTSSNANLNLSGAYSALGFGTDPTLNATVQPYPNLGFVDTSALTPDNQAGTLNITGSLAALNLDLSFQTEFSSLSANWLTQFNTAPPPYFTTFSGQWVTMSQSTLTPQQGCAAATTALNCAGY